METIRDKTRAYLYAFMVHLAVFASLFVGLLWTQSARPVAMIGPTIDAEIVGPSAAPRARAPSKPKPAPPKPVEPPPAPEPPKPPEVKEPPPTVQRNDNKEQEKIAEIAEQKAEQAKREQEEKHRQQQILLDEEKKRQEAEAKQQQIQKQLDDIHKERDKAAKQTRLAQEKMKQLDDLQKQQSQPKQADVPDAAVAKTGANGEDASLAAAYNSAITKVVTDNWNRPDTAPTGLRCAVRIVQIPGGTVISANIGTPCNADQITQESIKQAVTKAQPLPYRGYEKVFQREITFIFKYEGN
ncbi:MAG TPA: cell envelope integrity protein TolA [Rudaea sp.]|jgi:colicin import membrane protein|uniref:cell envelope integrity protein TolA n=1 Tax=Rudaea sp. TaxID=2136325 RepID=UPI002F950D1A